MTKRKSVNGGSVPTKSAPIALADEESLQREMALRAYIRYQNRGGVPGFDVAEWLIAEREVLAERANTSNRPLGRRARTKEPGITRSRVPR